MYIMVLDGNDLVFYKDSEGVHAGAYLINSKMLNNLTPVCEISQCGGGGPASAGSSIANMLSGLAVPAGLLMLQQEYGKNVRVKKTNTNEVVESSLYDKLVDLANVEDKKKTKVSLRKTKRNTGEKKDKKDKKVNSSSKRKTKKSR